MSNKINKSKEELKAELSPESFYVTQESGTERPFWSLCMYLLRRKII